VSQSCNRGEGHSPGLEGVHATHQQLINFLQDHAGHDLVYGDSVENDFLFDMHDDNDKYHDVPLGTPITPIDHETL
jgi:hypothetical protein